MDRNEPTVSNSSLGHPSNNRNATATPPPGSVKPQSTPSSRHADSYALALSSQGKRVVPKENQYLAVDLAQTKTVDPKRFASLILNMDLADLGASSDKSDGHWKKLESALDEYLKQTRLNPGNEPSIYPSAAVLFNAGSPVLGPEEDKILFYMQEEIPVRGAWVQEKPDIGAVFKRVGEKLVTIDKGDRDKVGYVFWALMLYAAELKHQKGFMLETPYKDVASGESQQSKTNRKRGREDDSTPTPSSKKVSSSSRNRNSTSAKLDKINQDQESKEFNKDTPEGLRRQVAGYARDMLSHGIFRSHAILIMLDDAMCRFVYYDHSAIVQSEVFDIRVDRTLFLRMLEQLHALNAQQLGIIPGLDAKFMKDPESLKKGVNLKWANIGEGPPSKWVLEGCFYTFPTPDGQERTVELGEVLFRSNGIIGRGTIVVRVKCAHKHGCRKGGPCDWEGLKLVMKINFPSEGRPSEPEIIKRCTDMAIERREKWVLKHLPKVFCSFTIHFDENSVQGRLMAEFPDIYEARVIRGSIQEELKPLMKLEASRQFAQVIYDVFQCHEWVYTHPKVLHRDISQSNIMAREENGNLYGVLNDFDLATVFETTSGHLPTSNHRTGTRPYMAYEQHSTSWQGPPRYRHDLESLFYVMLIMACHYTKPGVKAEKLPYLKWFTLGDELLFDVKYALIAKVPWEMPPIDDFFTGFKAWLRRIQTSLRRGVIGHGEYLEELQEAGSHVANDEQKHNTLCGYFSYDTMRVILKMFENEALLTRDPKRPSK